MTKPTYCQAPPPPYIHTPLAKAGERYMRPLRYNNVCTYVIYPRVYYDGVIHTVNAVHGPSWVMVFDSEESYNG